MSEERLIEVEVLVFVRLVRAGIQTELVQREGRSRAGWRHGLCLVCTRWKSLVPPGDACIPCSSPR